MSRSLKKDLVEAIRQNDHLSFAELGKNLPNHNIKGGWGFELRPDLVIWAGMSKRFVSVLRSLLQEQRIHLRLCSPLVYFMDGRSMQLPIAKHVRKKEYKKPHWLPTVMRLGPHPE